MSRDQNELTNPDTPTLPSMQGASGQSAQWPGPQQNQPPRRERFPRSWRIAAIAGSVGALLLGGGVYAASRGGGNSTTSLANTPTATAQPLPTVTPAYPTDTATSASTPTAGSTEMPSPTLEPSPASSPVPTITPAPKQYAEIQEFGTYALADYRNAASRKAFVVIGQAVMVECVIYDPNAPDPSNGDLWYRSSSGSYIATNTFWNQPHPYPPDLGYIYDPSVPVCSDSPAQDLPPAHT